MPQEKNKPDKSAKIDAELVPLTLRIPPEIHARLKEISETEYRSLNHQIIMALSYFIEVQEKFDGLPHPDFLKKSVPHTAQGFPAWLKGSATGLTGRNSK